MWQAARGAEAHQCWPSTLSCLLLLLLLFNQGKTPGISKITRKYEKCLAEDPTLAGHHQ